MRKRRDLEYAKICLEEWAKYMEDDNGFPSRSPTDKFGELKAHRAESSLPTNIEPGSREVNNAILVLSIMGDSSSRSKERASVLKLIYRNRCNDESVDQAMEKMRLKGGAPYFSKALDEFALRLDTVTYGNNEEISVMASNNDVCLEN